MIVASTQGTSRVIATEKAAHLLPNSCRWAPMVATQGIYNKINTRKAAAESGVKAVCSALLRARLPLVPFVHPNDIAGSLLILPGDQLYRVLPHLLQKLACCPLLPIRWES